MLALATGWTPKVIGSVPVPFRAACHWALYVRALVGDEGIPITTVGPGASLGDRLEAKQRAADLIPLRAALYPEDEDV